MVASTVLPDHVLRCMDPADRATLGKAGMTAEEATRKFVSGEERKLQNLIANYLNLHGIYYETDRMDKKPTGAKGRPDFRICFRGKFLGLEVKVAGGKVKPEQQAALDRIAECGGIGLVVWSLADVQQVLRAIDKQEQGNLRAEINQQRSKKD
jgi:hypothetical protein